MAADQKTEDQEVGKHARYLVDPDTNHPELVPKEDVEAKQKAGWKDPEGQRANGYEYNRPEDQLQTDAAGEMLTARREWQASEDAKKEKERKEAEDKANAAQKDAPKAVAPTPVTVVPAPASPPAAS